MKIITYGIFGWYILMLEFSADLPKLQNTVEPHYNSHLGAKSSWLLYRGGRFTEWHSMYYVYWQIFRDLAC